MDDVEEKESGPRAGVSYFIAPNGDDREPGSMERPFATLYRAHQVVEPGDTVNFRAGTYKPMISWTKGGTPDGPDHDPGLQRRRRDIAMFRAIHVDAR